jgi:hypothetical protein
MFNHTRKLLGVLALVVSSVAAAPAYAQAISDAVYQDMKEIIEELMTKEVSQAVAPHLACLSARTKATKNDAGAVDITTDPAQTDANGLGGDGDTYVTLDAVKYLPRTLQAIYDSQFTSLRPIVLSELAAFVADVAYRQLVAPPKTDRASSNDAKKQYNDWQQAATQATVRAARFNWHKVDANPIAKANRSAAPGDKIEITSAPLDNQSFENCAGNLSKELAKGSIGGIDTPLDTECNKPNRDEYACDVAYTIQAALKGDTSDAESHVKRALAEFVGELLLKSPLTDAQLTATVPVVNDMLNASNSTAAAVATACSQLTSVLKTGQCDDKFVESLTRLVDQWKAFHLTAGKPMSVATFVDWMGGLWMLIEDGCKVSNTSAACAFFPKARVMLGRASEFWPIIRLTGSGDYIDAAQLAIGELFAGLEKNCQSPNSASSEVCRLSPYYQRFADAVVVYVVQAHTMGTPSDETRGVFRSAVVDLIRELGTGGGVDRKWWSWEILLPDLALRYEWSPSYVNSDPGSGRTIASITWLKVRVPLWHSEMGFMALDLSAADVLAPLAELVLRSPNASYTGADKLWWNLIAPRIDVEGGIPALSKHLLFGAGLAYRLVAPWQTTAATSTAPAAYQYGSCLSQASKANCLEFGVFLKYII